MESKRRSFLKNASILAGTAILGKPLSAFADVSKSLNGFANANTVTLYHTGSLNGQLNSNKEQLGGLQEINRLIQKQEHHGLILDAGNFMGKSADGNIISMMNKTGYHAATVGPAELKNGQEALAALLPFMNFPLVSCNYSFSDPLLSSKVKPYVIIQLGNLKVGITGLGEKVAGVSAHDPYFALNNIASIMKVKEGCDLVICLSNLDPNGKTCNNVRLAEQSEHVDLIIGKNGPKVMLGAKVCRNSKREEVVLTQVGYDGLILGKTTFKWDATLKIKNQFQHQYLAAGLPLERNAQQARLILNKMNNVQLS